MRTPERYFLFGFMMRKKYFFLMYIELKKENLHVINSVPLTDAIKRAALEKFVLEVKVDTWKDAGEQ